jgi:DNA-binding transcriptional regulator YiaG
MATVERALRALIEDQTSRAIQAEVRDLEDKIESIREEIESLQDVVTALTEHLADQEGAGATLALELARAGATIGQEKFSRRALKSLRRKLDLTQKELADLLKVSPSTIAAWESERTEPSAENRAAIAALRDTSQEEVYKALGKEGKSRPLSASEIRRIREEIGISQAEFAEILGVSTNTVGYWETGRTSPRAGSLAAIHELAEAEAVPGVGKPGSPAVVEMPREKLSPEDIRQIRLDADMSQTDLAKELDVSINTVSNWENGHSYPRGKSLRRLIQMREMG